MADSRDYLIQQAKAIRDEYRKGANTAYRVGSLLLAMIEADVDLSGLEKYFLRKDKEDTAQRIITFVEGLVSSLLRSSDFTSGEFGSGYCLKNSDEGSYLEIDYLLVRRLAYFVELVIKSLRHVGGTIVLTPASMVCSKVEVFDTYYRCYFEQERDGRQINQEFVVGDQARAQEFNIKAGVSHNVSNQFYWRLVVGVGENYIDLSVTDCAAGSQIPKAGDDIVQLGNRYDTTRQNAIIISAVGDDAPSFKQYKGIDSYVLSDDDLLTVFSANGNTIKGKFISMANGYDFDEEFEKIRVDWDKVLEQTDKEFTMWFFAYEPALDNYPASDWTTAELTALHDQDLFYNTDSGKAYRFEAVDGVYGWHEVTDLETIKALEKAAKAQDTADSKRRNFVSQPIPPYDLGDRWSNATYGIYEDDDLVCINAKSEGESFDINDWSYASSSNSESLKKIETRIEQTEQSITLMAETIEGQSKTIAQMQVDADGVAKILAANFDAEGNVLESSGLVTTTSFTELFATALDSSGVAKTADLSVYVKKNADGTLESGVKITADVIDINNGVLKIDSDSAAVTGTLEVGSDFRIVGTSDLTQGLFYEVPDTSTDSYGVLAFRPRNISTIPRNTLLQENDAQANVFLYLERARNNRLDRVLYAKGISEFNGRVAISSLNAVNTTASSGSPALFVEGGVGLFGSLHCEPVIISGNATLLGDRFNFIYNITAAGTVDIQSWRDSDSVQAGSLCLLVKTSRAETTLQCPTNGFVMDGSRLYTTLISDICILMMTKTNTGDIIITKLT